MIDDLLYTANRGTGGMEVTSGLRSNPEVLRYRRDAFLFKSSLFI